MDNAFLSLSMMYFLHLTATVVWIGGLTVSALFMIPLAQRTLEPSAYALFFDRFRQRFNPFVWLSLMILLGTGLFQMSASPQYEGFLVVQNRWSVAIFVKHLVFGLMTAVSAWLTWGLFPHLNRLAWQRAQTQAQQEAQRLYHKELFWLRVNWVLSLIVLILTAIARVAADG